MGAHVAAPFPKMSSIENKSTREPLFIYLFFTSAWYYDLHQFIRWRVFPPKTSIEGCRCPFWVPPCMFSLSFSIFQIERERRTEGYRTWGERERERQRSRDIKAKHSAAARAGACRTGAFFSFLFYCKLIHSFLHTVT